jgi:ATP-dependent RNA helicase DDX3X
MAASLNMNGLSLNDSQHAPNGAPQQNGFQERSAYIPPHMRQRASQPPPPAAAPDAFDGPPPMSNGLNSSAWAPPASQK